MYQSGSTDSFEYNVPLDFGANLQANNNQFDPRNNEVNNNL